MTTGCLTPKRRAKPAVRSTTEVWMPATMLGMGTPSASFDMTSDSANTVQVDEMGATSSERSS